MKKKLFFIIFFLTSFAVADFTDYRDMYKTTTPDQFQLNTEPDDLINNTIIIFNKNYLLEWESQNISDFIVKDGELVAIAKNGIVYFEDGACGGLVLPDGVERISLTGDIFIATTFDKHYLYYIPECAQYNYVERFGHLEAVGGGMLCEASGSERLVRDAYTGSAAYYDEPKSPTISIFGNEFGCYFMQRNGEVDFVPAGKAEMKLTTLVDDDIFGVTTFDSLVGGFSGITKSQIFDVKFSPWGTVELNYRPISNSGYCIIAENSETPFCESEFLKAFAPVVLDSDKIVIGANNFFLQKDSILTVYGKEEGWEREFIPHFIVPFGCLDDMDLYFVDPLGSVWMLEMNSKPEKVEGMPLSCSFSQVYYNDGAFYTTYHSLIYRYAELVKSGSRNYLYRHESEDQVLFFIHNE